MTIHGVRIHTPREFVSFLMAISVRFVGFLLPDVKEKSIRSYRRKWTKRCSTIIWDSRKRCAFELNLVYNSGLIIFETTHPDSSKFSLVEIYPYALPRGIMHLID